MAATRPERHDHRETDTTRPNVARIYNYLAGGSTHFAADRRAAELIREANPDVTAVARDNKAWTARAVRWAAHQGIAQVLDLGAGLPLDPMPHQVAREVIPSALTAYVDNDPVAAEHLAALAAEEGPAVAAVDADLTGTGAVLALAGETLDFSEPACVLIASVLHFMSPAEARRIVSAYAAAVAPGSCIALSAGYARDAARIPRLRETYEAAQVHNHSPQALASFLAGLDIVPPGVVPARRWRGDWGPSAPAPAAVMEVLAAVAVKRR
jgi:hypothetical protein